VFERLPDDWGRVLELDHAYTARLDRGTVWAREKPTVYPPHDQVFRAFELTPFDSVRAVILGQDPYANEVQACGLAFSVPPGDKRPLSLTRILAKLEEDVSHELGTPYHVPPDATLGLWAHNGVLLLNTALTVAARQPASHAALWAPFTCRVLTWRSRSGRSPSYCGALTLEASNGSWIEGLTWSKGSAHPAARLRRDDPESFSCSHPFRDANAGLRIRGAEPINWRLD
jgi:uracil-DNA glycosylase